MTDSQYNVEFELIVITVLFNFVLLLIDKTVSQFPSVIAHKV